MKPRLILTGICISLLSISCSRQSSKSDANGSAYQDRPISQSDIQNFAQLNAQAETTKVWFADGRYHEVYKIFILDPNSELDPGSRSYEADKHFQLTYGDVRQDSYNEAWDSATENLEQDGTPHISEEARQYLITGKTLCNEARSDDDYKRAIDEFRKALKLCPGLLEAHYNLALADEAVGDGMDAILHLKIYLDVRKQFSKPEAYYYRKISDAERQFIARKIYELKAKEQKHHNYVPHQEAVRP